MPDFTAPVRWHSADAGAPAVADPMPAMSTAMLRGARGACPSCGQGRLFNGWLRVSDRCSRCDAPLGQVRADDAPPYFTIFAVAHVVIPGMLWLEKSHAPELWIHTAIWVPEQGIRVVYTTHAHRADGCDMGLFDDLYPPVADRSSLIDGTPGVEIFGALAPKPGEHVIKKHRYSGFFGTDLDMILREWGIKTVVVSGTTTENCCHATARDAMFNNYKVVFLSDATGTFDYPDVGQGALSADEVHRATLTILAFSTAHVMTSAEFLGRING